MQVAQRSSELLRLGPVPQKHQEEEMPLKPTCTQIVAHATETKNVVTTCYGTDLLRTLLPHLAEQLELCQKSLTAYLETKRAEFPRFYFVSDPTLLEILSLGSDPPSVVPHFPVRALRLPHQRHL